MFRNLFLTIYNAISEGELIIISNKTSNDTKEEDIIEDETGEEEFEIQIEDASEED